MKNKNIQVFGSILLSLTETLRSRVNLSTLDRKISHNPKKKTIKFSWKIKMLYAFQICEISELGTLKTCFGNKITNYFNGHLNKDIRIECK